MRFWRVVAYDLPYVAYDLPMLLMIYRVVAYDLPIFSILQK